MSTIEPPLPVDVLSPFKATRSSQQSRLEFYLLRVAQGLALAAFLSFCILWVQWQATAPGVSKLSGDFVSFWTAGQLALQGHASAAYSKLSHFPLQIDLHHDPGGWGYLAFFYPPFFLLLCTAFALLGYFPALCVWLVTTLACYVAALRALMPKGLREGIPVWVVFLGYPAVMINAGFGQNGFLSAGLFGGAAVWLDRRPALAGICLGCLAYKPQLGVIVPLGLIVARRWRCFAFAAATVLVLAAAATLAFGTDVWPAFMGGMAEARRDWMEPPNPLYLIYWVTVFGAVRLHGGSLALAYGAQAAVTIAAAFMLLRALWQQPPGARSGRAEIAAIAACVPFCSPFMLEYDLIILAVPMVWLLGEALRDGFRRGELTALVAAYLAPAVFKVSAFDNALKLGVIVAAALLLVVVLRRMAQPSAHASALDRAVLAA
jgi:alpha-1,2-mannosyltransferase